MGSYLREAMTAAFSVDQRRALTSHQADQDRTAEAIDQLSAALTAPAALRAAVWRRNVADSLEMLDEAFRAEAAAHGDPDSLPSDIARTQPRLRNRVRGLRVEYTRVGRQLRHALGLVAGGPDVGVAEIRARLGDLINALRLLRCRESDLIYEAYFEAFDRDIEEELGGSFDR